MSSGSDLHGIKVSRKRWKIEKLGQRDHPGVIAALKSDQNKRSTRNAYILLLGASGTGKSSMINFLFGRRSIAKVGNFASETNTITEYVLPVDISQELGITNSELHIIDTPGLADTEGLEKDARFLQSLEEFFKNHRDLGHKFPTLVIISGKFDDNRFYGESSTFARVFSAIEKLSNLFIDQKHPNAIVALTHVGNQKESIQRQPEAFLDVFESALKNFVNLPFNIPIVLAENQPEDSGLEMSSDGDYVTLLNGDYYPFNVFKVAQSLAMEGGDPIGEAIIRNAFRSPRDLRVATKYKTQLVLGTHPGVSSKIDDLNNVMLRVEDTQLTLLLSENWKLVPRDLRDTFPVSLQILQVALNRRKIKSLDQLPNNRNEIVDFLKELPHNPAVMFMLENSLSIRIPQLPDQSVVGFCYSIITDSRIPICPFNLGQAKLTPMGFTLPEGIQCSSKVETADICNSFDTRDEYIQGRMMDLGVQGSVSWKAFQFGTRNGYNSKQDAVQNSRSASFTSVHEHRLFQLQIPLELELNKSFVSDVNNLCEYDPTSEYSVNTWKGFFSRYGTHVVTSAFGGGSLCLKKTAEFFTENTEAKTAWFTENSMRFSSIFSLDVNASGLGYSNSTFSDVFKNAEIIWSGGDPQFQQVRSTSQYSSDTAHCFNEGSGTGFTDVVRAQELVKKWKATLNNEPVMLEGKMTLAPLSFFARKVNPVIANAMDIATRNLFEATLEFRLPPPRPRPPPRPDILPPTPPASGSCLKAGTRILMGDKTLKAIELVLPGDVVLDRNFRPCQVIAKNYTPLGNRKFYGFEKGCYFFTGDHLFVGGRRNGDNFYVARKAELLKYNPLLEHLNVSEMAGQFDIYQLDSETLPKKLSLSQCQLHTDPKMNYYDKDEKVYYMIVSSPTGTYVANGYVCRHELPPFKIWPETFKILSNVLLSEKVSKLAEEILNYDKLQELQSEVFEILRDIEKGNLRDYLVEPNKTLIKDEIGGSDNLDLLFMARLSKILESSTLAAFGLLLYSVCGKTIAKLVDGDRKGEYVGSESQPVLSEISGM